MLRFELSAADRALVSHYAEHATLGGRSHVRSAAERGETVAEDQVVGFMGEAAFHRYWFGDLGKWVEGRERRDETPWEGDQSDVGNVDVKCSLMRRSQDPLDYRLLVRPAERGKCDWYVLALVERSLAGVWLVGWYQDEALPPVTPSGPFAGAHVVSARVLNPLPPMRW